mmetsp:Transcript_17118/g.47419  ORF Transcript_17118/g.47419 Transcript_17118/m.47419 type:complete len:89 (+) Transcript_17118:26-292(+)
MNVDDIERSSFVTSLVHTVWASFTELRPDLIRSDLIQPTSSSRCTPTGTQTTEQSRERMREERREGCREKSARRRKRLGKDPQRECKK